MIQLPRFSPRTPRIIIFLGVLILSSVLYGLSGTYYLNTPYLVPITIIDTLIPFNPNFVVFYLSSYIYIFFVYAFCKKDEDFYHLLWSFFGLAIISCILFWIFPSTVPRQDFPIQESYFFLVKLSTSLIRQIDVAYNCLPSLHVSSAILSAYFVKKTRPEYFKYANILSLCIIYSTMAMKQHYFIDVVAGAGLGISVIWASNRFFKF